LVRFEPCMRRAAEFLHSVLEDPPSEGIRRVFLDTDILYVSCDEVVRAKRGIS